MDIPDSFDIRKIENGWTAGYVAAGVYRRRYFTDLHNLATWLMDLDNGWVASGEKEG